MFTIGSGLCAAAWSVEWLMVFRVIQGVGAGILAPLGFAITVLVFPPEQRGRGLALIAVVALVSSALGPVLGGVLIEIASWHWIFLINIPVGRGSAWCSRCAGGRRPGTSARAARWTCAGCSCSAGPCSASRSRSSRPTRSPATCRSGSA